MKTLAEYTDLKIPSWAICPIVYGDNDGLDDDEIKMIDDYMQTFYDKAKELNGIAQFCAGNQESYFSPSPEFGLGSDVIDCTILILKGE